MEEYKHGVYGVQVPTADQLPPSGVATLPVYVGTAPVQQLAEPDKAVNAPFLVNSYEDAKAKIGYSDDWDTFSLCEAVYAHFKNRIQPIGPIVVINVMDPLVHVTSTTSSVAITNGVGYIDAPAVLSSIEIVGLVRDTDFKAEYTTDGRVKLTEIVAGSLVNPADVTYDVMDVSTIQNSDIIGGNTNGVRTGASLVELVHQNFNMIPTILAAPGWSHTKEIKEGLVTASQKINGHWDAIVAADLDSIVSTTIEDAIAWKETNLYSEVNVKVGWPKASSDGKSFYASTLMVVRMQQTDYENDNTPYVSPSNKQVDVSSVVLSDGTVVSFDEVEANELNKNGITTFNFRSGIWVLWGPHNANYEFGADIDPKNVFDASIRMMMYLTNSFQDMYMADVDGPLTRSKVGTILNEAGTWLNSMVADGKLLYANIAFNETNNPTSSIVEGDFVFDVTPTLTPVAKSITFKLQYTSKGLNTLFGGEQ